MYNKINNCPFFHDFLQHSIFMHTFCRKSIVSGFWILLIGFLLPFCLTACSPSLLSPNGRFQALQVKNDEGKHYKVIDTKDDKTLFVTHAQYETENDVKKGLFSSDSTKFAAAYHYSHEGAYTWVGIWSTETGEFLSAVRLKGWVKRLDNNIFN